MKKQKAVISLFDLSGEAIRPWYEDGYQCFCFDAQHPRSINLHPEIGYATRPGSIWTVGGQAISPMGEMDDMSWTSIIERLFKLYDVQLVMGWPPCTDLATSGARWMAEKKKAAASSRSSGAASSSGAQRASISGICSESPPPS